MLRQDAFALIALALVGIVCTIYLAVGATPFFPSSLRTQTAECPASHFPARRWTILDEFSADWYSSELQALHEQPLFEDAAKAERTVRFTLLRSFHASVMVRTIEADSGETRLVAKWMAGRDDCGATGGGCVVDRMLTASEQDRLRAVQGPLNRPSYGCPSGIDGTMWLFEASGRGEYRFWSEWSPVDSELRDLGLVMLDLTGWNLSELY
jgi:hypothetical protein